MRRSEPTEAQSQATVIAWWDLSCKSFGLPAFSLYAVPNGAVLAGNAQRRAIQMAALKRAGLRPGIPDLCLDVARRQYHGLRIEMKRAPNKPAEEQMAVLRYLRLAGYDAHVCWSADQAIEQIKVYLRPD